jgi:RNA polymerase sigma-70 factor (ECF subfamily)
MDSNVAMRAQRGDEQAFAAIADAVIDRFLGTAERILRDPGLADDATQQALVTMWRSLPDLRDPERFAAWSCKLLVRVC